MNEICNTANSATSSTRLVGRGVVRRSSEKLDSWSSGSLEARLPTGSSHSQRTVLCSSWWKNENAIFLILLSMRLRETSIWSFLARVINSPPLIKFTFDSIRYLVWRWGASYVHNIAFDMLIYTWKCFQFSHRLISTFHFLRWLAANGESLLFFVWASSSSKTKLNTEQHDEEIARSSQDEK